MFVSAVSFAKSRCHCDFVKASYCSFCQNCRAHCSLWFCQSHRECKHVL